MLLSIVGSKGPMTALALVPERQRRQVALYPKIHRALMAFFLCGYLVVLVAFPFHDSFLSETFVSVIFLFGAIFVLLGVVVQARLLLEVQRTLQGTLPIWRRCKKIRAADGDCKDPKAWKGIEDYISERIDVDFSHGFCPKCYAEEMKTVQKMKGEA